MATTLYEMVDVRRFRYRKSDRDLFATRLGDFVPPGSFDAHAHLYDMRHVVDGVSTDEIGDDSRVGHTEYVGNMRQWMGNRVVSDGLFFPLPVEHLDCQKANQFLADELAHRPTSRGLMIIRPTDDPGVVAATLDRYGFVGFKVYHVFAERDATMDAEQGEFLPEWAWELADTRSLVIMMHMVLPTALSDVRNQSYHPQSMPPISQC